MAAPLTALTSSKVPFLWSSAANEAFQSLKTRFTTPPILVMPDTEQFVIEVDASDVGVGAISKGRHPSEATPLRLLLQAVDPGRKKV